MSREKSRNRIVLRFGIACMVHWKPEELDVLPRLFHERHKGRLPAEYFIFDLRNRKQVDIRMGVGVISQIESLKHPLHENL